MEPKGFRRKLTAILSADVAGYSRLMQDDETATVKTLEAYKQIISDLVKQHRGRVVDSPGDNLLAEFASVVDAVQCAVATQKELQSHNTELPENRKMLFRIGVNLGDVIEEESRIYGDGVNIAARLESLADPGGICVSKTAFDHIESKLPFGYAYLGEQTVKNISKPVGAYKVLMDPRVTRQRGRGLKAQGTKQRMAVIGLVALLVIIAGGALWHFFIRSAAPTVEKADPKQMALPLPEQPSIAVLPFANLSEDPKQELLCDGITDNIINALSKVPGLFVIARNSTLPYKSKPVKARQVSEELGVRYVLDGSVQWSGDRVRITAQMVDAITGKQLLSERYEGETSKVFAAQDDIAMKVLGSIMKLTNQTVGTEWTKYSKDPHGLDCFLKFQEGVRFLNRMTLAGAKQTQQIVEEGLAMCPENPSLYRLLAAAYINYYFYDSSRPPRESIEKATELLQKTLSLDSNNAFAHGSLSIVYLQKREYDKAIAEGELSASLDPGSPMTAFCYAKALVYGGRSEEAIPLLEKAIRLNPLAPAVYYNDLGHALRMTGRLEEAATEYKKSIKIAPNDFWIHAALAVVYIMMGRDEEAHAEAAETLRINPKFTLELYAKRSLFKDQSVVEGNIDVMRKAGLPDKPPLPLPDKPSIAVLPFTNLSDDKSQEYFSDGLTEEIITALSKTPKLFVIARNSSFVYKGKPVNVQQASRELGVKYVLEGTVRRSGDQLRITTQLIDAISGNHLWAEQYDRELKDIFAIQDDVTMKILTSLQVTLTEGESARFLERGTDNLEAYLKTMEGREFLGRLNKDDNAIAQRKFKEAISLDPKFARPYAGLSICYTMDFSFQIDPQESLRKAYEYAQKAIAIDETQLLAHGALEFVYGWKRQYEMAIASGERAVQVAPGCADAYFYLGRALSYACRDKEAVGYFDKAIRMNPFPPSFYYMHLGMAHFNLRQYEQAVLDLKKALTLSPKNQPARRALIGTYIEMGRLEEAKAEGVEVLKIEPNYTSKGIEKILPFRDQEVRKRWADALRLVGLERDVSAQ